MLLILHLKLLDDTLRMSRVTWKEYSRNAKVIGYEGTIGQPVKQ